MLTAVNCHGLRVASADASSRAMVLLQVEGAASTGVVLEDSRPEKFDKLITYINGAVAAAVVRR
jgi:hypothetical protein